MSPKDTAFLLSCARKAAAEFVAVPHGEDYDAAARKLQIALYALLPAGAIWSDKVPEGFGLWWALERKPNRKPILVEVYIASGGAQCFRVYTHRIDIDNPKEWRWCATRTPPEPEDQPK